MIEWLSESWGIASAVVAGAFALGSWAESIRRAMKRANDKLGEIKDEITDFRAEQEDLTLGLAEGVVALHKEENGRALARVKEIIGSIRERRRRRKL